VQGGLAQTTSAPPLRGKNAPAGSKNTTAWLYCSTPGGRRKVPGAEGIIPVQIVVAGPEGVELHLCRGRVEPEAHGRYITFQMAKVAVPRQMFADVLSSIARLHENQGVCPPTSARSF
jgi:hypothetical protein